jgi:hypothetical protein
MGLIPRQIVLGLQSRTKCSGNKTRIEENAGRNLVENPEGKPVSERPSRVLEGNIKMEVKQDGTVLSGFIWLRVGSNGRQL